VDEPVPDGGQAPEGGQGAAAPVPTEVPGVAMPPRPNGGAVDQAAAKSSSRRLLIGGAIVVVAALVVAGLVLLVTNVSNAISTGTGTATITWTPATGTPPPVGNLPQSFGGTIKGIGVSGINRTTISANGFGSLVNPSGKPPTEIQVFRLNGSFGGKAFTLGVFYELHNRPSAVYPQINVRGTYGTLAVNGTITPPSVADLNKGSVPADFHGTVGSFKVSGLSFLLLAMANGRRRGPRSP
jgi:hypothetical protein